MTRVLAVSAATWILMLCAGDNEQPVADFDYIHEDRRDGGAVQGVC